MRPSRQSLFRLRPPTGDTALDLASRESWVSARRRFFPRGIGRQQGRLSRREVVVPCLPMSLTARVRAEWAILKSKPAISPLVNHAPEQSLWFDDGSPANGFADANENAERFFFGRTDGAFLEGGSHLI